MWWRVTSSGKSSLRGSSWEGTYRAHSSGMWLWEENIPGSRNTKCKGLVGISLGFLRNKQKPLSKGEWWGRSVDWDQKFRKEPDQKGPWRSWWSVWILFEVHGGSHRQGTETTGQYQENVQIVSISEGPGKGTSGPPAVGLACQSCAIPAPGHEPTHCEHMENSYLLTHKPGTCGWPPAAGPLPALRTVWLCISLWNVEVCLPLSFTLILPSAVDRSGIWPTSSFTREES